MVGEVVSADVLHGLVVQTRLDPTEQPFLDDHRIDGTAVLPGVMGIEAFAEAARLLVPDRHVVSVEDVDFRAPVKFYRDEPRTLTVTALVRPEGDDLVAECSLSADRVLAGTGESQHTVCFTGSVRLGGPSPEAPASSPIGRPDGATLLDHADVYRLYFHGPAFQVVGAGWREDEAAVVRLAADLPPGHRPADLPTLLAPRLVELCFQAAGLWEAGVKGRLALPAHVGRVLAPVGMPESGDGLVAVARPRADGSELAFDCTVLDAEGRVVLEVEDYRTVVLPGPIAEDVLAPIQAVMAEERDRP
jgi:hypothetical protein